MANEVADYGPIARGEVTPDNYADANDAEYYCPACGRRAVYLKECTGRGEAPHPPVLVVPTAELKGDPANHTPAPSTE